MEDFNNNEQTQAQENNLSVEEQISNLEKSINGNTETPVAPTCDEEVKNENQVACEVEPKKCNCNSGHIIGVCGLILSIAAIILFVLMYMGVLNGKSTETTEPETPVVVNVDNAEASDVAYIDLDTLLLTYNYAIKLQEDLAMEQKKMEGTIQTRMKKFEDMYNAYAEKARTGMFLSAASQQAQQTELEKEQQAIENLQTNLTNQLLEKQNNMNKEIYDSVVNFVNQYSTGKYKIVLGNMGGVNVVYAQPGMNITTEIVDKLNQRYGGILASDVDKK